MRTMRNAVALMLGVLLPLLGFAGVGQAQSSIQVQGTIQAVDCDAQTITLSGDGGTNTVAVGPYTAILVGSTSVPLCALQQYIGAPVSIWLVASGSEFAATQVNVSGDAYAPPPAPAPAAYAPAPLPIVGVVLGTIVVAGLVYLLVHGPDGGYYRYPYYGPYYHHYYRSYYHPYHGYYPGFAPVILVPAPIVGVVLGTIVVGTLAYLVSRDNDGHFYRYPYYGPYRGYYSLERHAAYQPYRGAHGGAPFNAPVRQGDPRWDGPSHAGGGAAGPAFHGSSDPRPGYAQPQTDRRNIQAPPAPAYRNQPAPGSWQRPQTDRRNIQAPPAPAYRNQPAPGSWQQPQTDRRNVQAPPASQQPAYRGPAIPRAPSYGTSGPQQYGRHDAGGSGRYNRDRRSNCTGNQSCQDGGH